MTSPFTSATGTRHQRGEARSQHQSVRSLDFLPHVVADVRVWNPTTRPSLHRSQISENFDFKEYVIDAGSGSRIRPATAGPILLLFGDKNFQVYVSILHFENRLLNGREVAV